VPCHRRQRSCGPDNYPSMLLTAPVVNATGKDALLLLHVACMSHVPQSILTALPIALLISLDGHALPGGRYLGCRATDGRVDAGLVSNGAAACARHSAASPIEAAAPCQTA
jgi:hypothetical protein